MKLTIALCMFMSIASGCQQLHRTPKNSDQVMLRGLARDVADTYRGMNSLALVGTITESIQKPNGGDTPSREVARVDAAMAEGGKLRLAVMDPSSNRVVLNRVSNGKTFNDWNDDASETAAISQSGNFLIETSVDGCYVGGFLESWVGRDSKFANIIEKRVAGGVLSGSRGIDGVSCPVVDYERVFDGYKVRDTFVIDPNRKLIREWTTTQADISDSGEVISAITRQRTYTNIRTEPLPESTFLLTPGNIP